MLELEMLGSGMLEPENPRARSSPVVNDRVGNTQAEFEPGMLKA
jgi:hypothetical protein